LERESRKKQVKLVCRGALILEKLLNSTSALIIGVRE
jgi:hypothetical protein